VETTALLVTAFVVGLSGAMTPGPLLTATIAETARRGFKAGPLIVLGHAILELVLILALLKGLSNYLTRESVTSVIAIMGGGFLLFMGFTMTRDGIQSRLSIDNFEDDKPQGIRLHPVATGILISLGNPYWIIWWATVGLSFITSAFKDGPVGITAFYTGHIAADLIWYSLVALAVASGRRFFTQGVYNFILSICGIFLLGLGGYFIYSGII
jgi:threonine/homoserine/homoserine lactone efflux protein